MMAELHSALNDSPSLIQEILNSLNSNQKSNAESIIAEKFKSIFNKDSDRVQIPLLNVDNQSKLQGRLIRFTGMVQDTGFGTEVYNRIGSTSGELLLFGKEEESVKEDYSNLGERQSIFVIETPGKSNWVQNSSAGDLSNDIANLSIDPTSSTTTAVTSPFDNKFPIPDQIHFGTIAKLYDQSIIDSIKICGVYEFIGILGDTPLSRPFEDLMETNSVEISSIPALHVICVLPPLPISLSFLSNSKEEIIELRKELIEYLSAGLGNDLFAAEWLFFSLLARIHTRHPTGVSLGQLSLNLAFPISDTPTQLPLQQILSSLVEKSTSLELSIPFLNDTKIRIAPRNKEENLESGRLQLSDGTVVLVDVRGVAEGKLFDTGVKNLQILTSTIETQKLSYEFPYSNFDLETDLNFILISQGKSFIPTSCVVQVQPTQEPKLLIIPESKLQAFRSFIHSMKFSEFSIPPNMSQVIQNDFVNRRQNSIGGESMTQDDLLFRMTIAKLLSLSNGLIELKEEIWLKTGDLDEKRKEGLLPNLNSKPMKE